MRCNQTTADRQIQTLRRPSVSRRLEHFVSARQRQSAVSCIMPAVVAFPPPPQPHCQSAPASPTDINNLAHFYNGVDPLQILAESKNLV